MVRNRRRIKMDKAVGSMAFRWYRRWILRWTLKMFDERIYDTGTLNRVVTPYATSVLLIMMLEGAADTQTRLFIEDLLELPIGAERDTLYKGFRFLSSQFKTWVNIPLTIIYRIVADEDVDLPAAFRKFRSETFDQHDTVVDFESRVDLNELLYEFHGLPFKTPIGLADNLESRMFGLVATRLQFGWRDCKSRPFGLAFFLLAYGVKKATEFFSLFGQFQTIRRGRFEAWALPLDVEHRSLAVSLVLIRPNCIGDLLDLIEHQFSVNQLNRALDDLLKQKSFRTHVLLPTVQLTAGDRESQVVNLTTAWKEDLKMHDLRFGLQDGATSILQILHSARVSINSEGVGFGNTLSSKNLKETSHSSATTSRVPEEKFALRLDSPFIWIVWERNHGLPLLAGSYGGGHDALDLAEIREYNEKRPRVKEKCCIM